MHRHLPLVALCLLATPALSLDLPARKAGLWEIKVTMEGRSMAPQTMQQCIDAATDKLMQSMGASMGQNTCAKQDVQKAGNTLVIDSVCQFGAVTTTSHGVITGDFNSGYTVKMTSQRSGGPAGMPADGVTNMTIEAKWVSACKADQRPGDIIMAGGNKVNITDMPAMPGGRPAAAPAQKK